MALYQSGKRISGIRDFPAYTWAAYHALPVAKRPRIWNCTDRDYTEIPPEAIASVTADGVKTQKTMTNELVNATNASKLSWSSLLVLHSSSFDYIYRIVAFSASEIIFVRSTSSNSGARNIEYDCKFDSSTKITIAAGGSVSDVSNNVVNAGDVWTLYK